MKIDFLKNKILLNYRIYIFLNLHRYYYHFIHLIAFKFFKAIKLYILPLISLDN